MKNKVRQQIAYDIRMGIVRRWKPYLFFSIVMIVLCFSINGEARERILPKLNAADIYVKLFGGMHDFSDAERTQTFHIPAEWLIIQLGFVLMTIKYPKSDFVERGMQVFIRTKSKKNWWLGKCVWLIGNTILYYAILHIVVLAFSCFLGGCSLNQEEDIWKVGIIMKANWKNCLALYGMPFLVSLTLGHLCLAFSLLYSPMIALCTSTACLVASAYWCHPLLIGNYTMLLRNDSFIGTEGVDNIMGFIICICINGILGWITYWYFRKADIFLELSNTEKY